MSYQFDFVPDVPKSLYGPFAIEGTDKGFIIPLTLREVAGGKAVSHTHAVLCKMGYRFKQGEPYCHLAGSLTVARRLLRLGLREDT